MRHFLRLFIFFTLAVAFLPAELAAQSDLKDQKQVVYNYRDVENNDSYVGIGVVIERERDYPWMHVRKVLKNGPAHKAGLKKGDSIVKINNVSVVNKTIDDVAKLMLGEAETMLKLEYMRNHKFFTVTVERKAINF